jgi:uncharacterized protein
VREHPPRTGPVTVRVQEAPGGRWSIALRVPSWAKGATPARAGRVAPFAQDGMAGAEADWRPGDGLRLKRRP